MPSVLKIVLTGIKSEKATHMKMTEAPETAGQWTPL